MSNTGSVEYGPAPDQIESFNRIVVDYRRCLYGFAHRMIGNREDAEEIVQDAFFRAYLSLRKMSLEQHRRLRVKPWLYAITLNVTRNRIRRNRPTCISLDAALDLEEVLRGPHDSPATPEVIAERNADFALVEHVLQQMPTQLRLAATLRFIRGYSQLEIAEVCHQPVGTVKSHIHRATLIMRRTLASALGVPTSIS
jgi:RNA polymerase sigma-70 factor (ECF subfamily)